MRCAEAVSLVMGTVMTKQTDTNKSGKPRISYAFRPTKNVREIIDEASEVTKLEFTQVINEMVELGKDLFWELQKRKLLDREAKRKTAGMTGGTNHTRKE